MDFTYKKTISFALLAAVSVSGLFTDLDLRASSGIDGHDRHAPRSYAHRSSGGSFTDIPHAVRAELVRLSGRQQESSEKQRFHSPTNTVIAFDFHDVLGQFNFGLMGKDGKGRYQFGLGGKLAQYGTIVGACALVGGLTGVGLVVAPFVGIAALAARKMLKKDKNGYKKPVEAAWNDDGTVDGKILSCLKPEFVTFESLFVPNEQTFDLVRKLKQAGYKVMLASNIGPDSLKELKERYPEHFALFDAELIPNDVNDWVSKKLPKEYFVQLADIAHDLKKQHVVFVDDSKKNCDNADWVSAEYLEKVDLPSIDGIQFSSAEQLQKDLVDRGILIN